MGTRFAPRPGKPGKVDKPPHRVRRGQPVVKASKSEPENWATFAEACEAYERGDVDAIGLVLTADDPYFGLDEDDVLDHATGEVDATAHHIVHALGTYAEVSCSGTGLRAIGIGSKPEYAGCKSRALGFGVELYDGTNRDGSEATSAAAFLVMTGNHLPGTPEGVEERQGELEALCRQLWPKTKKKLPRKAKPSGAHSLEDAELLERARRARTGAKFRRLFDRGDATGYPSESEADFALLNMLCFWTAGDAERMAQLFEGSALYRPDEKEAPPVCGAVGTQRTRKLFRALLPPAPR
jgi:putative DNA primase/helicase